MLLPDGSEIASYSEDMEKNKEPIRKILKILTNFSSIIYVGQKFIILIVA